MHDNRSARIEANNYYYADTSENHFLKSPFAPDLKSLCSLDSKQYYPQMSVVVLGSEEQ